MWLRCFPRERSKESMCCWSVHLIVEAGTISVHSGHPWVAVFLMMHPFFFACLKYCQEGHTFGGWLELPLANGMTRNATGFVGAHVLKGRRSLPSALTSACVVSSFCSGYTWEFLPPRWCCCSRLRCLWSWPWCRLPWPFVLLRLHRRHLGLLQVPRCSQSHPGFFAIG
jgi:hypothetical protein